MIHVRESLARGISREQTAEALRNAGWSSQQVSRALGAFATFDFPVPVPRPRPSLSAREAFIYLLLFTSLYLVQLINPRASGNPCYKTGRSE